MGPLSEAYARARANEPPAPAAPHLEDLLARLCERARAGHPELEVPDAAFVAHLARCGADLAGEPASLHAADLYHACACLRGDERAVALLVSAHQETLAKALRRIDPSASFADDVRQRFWDAALVGTMSSPPRLATYSGRGSLAGWIAVAGQRIALMMRRHEDAEGRARRTADDADAALRDPELAIIKDRYREGFRAATQRALETLDDRERMIFRLHLVDGLTVERIGRAYGVSHSTVSRWFAGAREKVVTELRRILREEMDIAPSDFESLKRLVISQLDVSLSMLSAPPALR